MGNGQDVGNDPQIAGRAARGQHATRSRSVPSGPFTGQRGDRWINGGYLATAYNHFATPNSPTWDCLNKSNNYGLKAARSKHSGGVTMLFCDGSVRFVTNNVQLDDLAGDGHPPATT